MLTDMSPKQGFTAEHRCSSSKVRCALLRNKHMGEIFSKYHRGMTLFQKISNNYTCSRGPSASRKKIYTSDSISDYTTQADTEKLCNEQFRSVRSHRNKSNICNKKVLLRERKRHTDRGVSSTPSVIRGGVPPPSQVQWGEVGYPPQPGLTQGEGGTQGGVPPGQVQRGGGYPR